MATFEKRAGHWRVQVRRAGVSKSATFPTKAQAQAWAADIEREAIQVAAGGLPTRSFRQALEKYRDEVSPTKRGSRWELIRINAFIGSSKKVGTMADLLDKNLADMTAPMLVQWRDDRLKVVGAASVIREINLLSSIFETARREWHWLDASPLKDVRRPKQPPHRTRRISADEISRICLALGYDDAVDVTTVTQQVAVAWLLAIETAMRQGEALGLRWEYVGERVAHLPKTKNGHARDVPLSKRAVQLLTKLKGLDTERCFTLSSASCDVLFRRARDAAGVPDLHFHDSRREGTSRLSKKVDVLTLARITGHRDLKMLLVYYQTDMAEVASALG